MNTDNISIIVAFNKKFGIGKDGKLPWHIPEDLKHFRDLTKDGVCIMGHKTYLSIPEKYRPLRDRLNIVVTLMPWQYKSDARVLYVTLEELDGLHFNKNIFICGGEFLYKKYMGIANKLYATLITDNTDKVECDTFFPIENFNKYEISEYSPQYDKYRFITYTKSKTSHGELAYLQLLRDVGTNGNYRPDRTGTGTTSMFAPDPLRFDISKSIPLYTTKFVPIKAIIKELLWFLRGETDSKILEAQGVNIWKDNTSREFLDKRGLTNYIEGDLGPLYGVNLRAYNAEYHGCQQSYIGKGIDQIQNLITGLKEDPYSRRHLITTFNPATVSQCVLYPCHGIAIMFYVGGADGRGENDYGGGFAEKKHLSCHVTIRSNDLLLGNPFNVASYAILVYIIAKKVDMKPKDLIISIGDAHIYKTHKEAIELLLKRSVLPFPVLEVNDNIKDIDISEIKVEDFNLVGYLSHDSIKAPMAI